MGSVCIALPARLGHAGDVTLVGGLAQADPAEAEFAVVRAGAAAATAAVVFAALVLGFAALSGLLGSLGHLTSSPRRRSRRPRCRHPRCPRRPSPAWRTPRGSLLSIL